MKMQCNNRIACGLILFALAILPCSCASSNKEGRPIAPEASVGPSDPDAPTEYTTTASGLQYRILRKSDGPKPTAGDTVSVHYRGWLESGKEFDSSYKRGEPATFPLGGVIPGWTEGLQYVGKGGMIELEIPYQLGYGSAGAPPDIPPFSTLYFTIELLEIM